MHVNTHELWGDIQDYMLTHVNSRKYTGLYVNTCKLWEIYRITYQHM